jgi:hypothetical protein
MTVKINPLVFTVSFFVRQIVGTSEHEILCNVCFAGFNKRPVGDSRSTVLTGKQTVIGKVVLDGDPLGHPQIIATTLATVRDRFNSTNLNSVVHVRSRPFICNWEMELPASGSIRCERKT